MNEIVITKDYAIPTKSEVAKQVKKLVEQATTGWVEAESIKMYGMLTALEQVIKGAKKELLPIALEEANRRGEKSFEMLNADFMIKNLPGKPDFTISEKWCKENERLEKAKKSLTRIEEDIMEEMRLAGVPRPSGGETLQVTLRK
jgi:hypothetical protein